MKRFRFPWSGKGDKGKLESKSVEIHNLSLWKAAGSSNAESKDNSAVASVVSVIVGASAEPYWCVQDESETEDLKHPVLALLENPNPEMPGSQMEAAIVTALLFHGNAYLLPVRDGRGEVRELWFLNPTAVSLNKDAYQRLRGYWYNSVAGRKSFAPDEIIHIRDGCDPDEPLLGFSRLRTALLEVMTDKEATEYTNYVLKNLGVTGLILTLEDPQYSELDDDAAEAVKLKVRKATTGANRGDVVVISAPMKIHNPGVEPDKLALDKLKLIPERRICAVMGTPAIVANLGEDPKYDNYGQAREAWYEQRLLPLWSIVGQALTSGLRTMLKEGERIVWSASKVAALAKQREEILTLRSNRARADFESGVCDLYEVRKASGYEARPEDKGKTYSETAAPKRQSLQAIREKSKTNRDASAKA